MSRQEAIDSGLWGFNVEEATVLVDYRDKDRLRAYYAACASTDEDLDMLKEHIDSFDNGDPDEQEYILFDYPQKHFIRMWLLLRRHGIPKWAKAKNDSRYKGCYDQFGLLQPDHHLVKAVKETLPKYRPIMIFELCQNSQHLLIMEHLSDKSAFGRVCQELFRKQIYSLDAMREHLSHNIHQ
ncbi:hypothetical protein DPV78_005369 [Talaromyces pinophilus]|nr:hypothetical protein DPV78_005369 [Talaromyces pinophilus]